MFGNELEKQLHFNQYNPWPTTDRKKHVNQSTEKVERSELANLANDLL